MKYTGIPCPICKQSFAEGDDVVVCPDCGTPLHRECWRQNGGCANGDRHQEGFIWESPLPKADLVEAKRETKAENAKICPVCGAKNDPFEPVCTSCGQRLKANRISLQDQLPMGNSPFAGYEGGSPNNFSPYQNPYAADARAVYGAETTVDGVLATDIAEYVQRDSTKYIGKFLQLQEKKTKLSWNWSAGIFSVFWCFYRKMVGCGLALVAILMAAFMFSSVLPAVVYERTQPQVFAQYQSDLNELSAQMETALATGAGGVTEEYFESFSKVLLSPVTISSYVMLGALVLLTGVIFGFFANYFYKNKIIKDIKRVQIAAVDAPSYHLFIRQRGGVSVANVLIPLICYMFFNMISTYM